MADDDENKPKKHTFESLFHVYCNYQVYSMELDNENFDCILLSEIDYWLDQAKLLRTVFSTTETGLLYMKFKKWRLNYEDFLEFLQQLCVGKDIKFEDLKQILLEAGVPGGAEIVIVK